MKRKFILFLIIFLFIVLLPYFVLSQWNYYIRDHLGSTRVVLDENGNVKEYYDYHPYGLSSREVITGSEKARYKFAGKELDDRDGLDWYNFGRRYYDPGIGRWLSPDPLAEKYPGLSPYVYAANNPLNLIDPDGNFVLDSKLKNNNRFMNLINKIEKYSLANSKVQSAFSRLNTKVSDFVTMGSGPRLVPKMGMRNVGFFKTSMSSDKSTIELSQNIVDKLSNAKSGNEIRFWEYVITISILHETGHWSWLRNVAGYTGGIGDKIPDGLTEPTYGFKCLGMWLESIIWGELPDIFDASTIYYSPSLLHDFDKIFERDESKKKKKDWWDRFDPSIQ